MASLTPGVLAKLLQSMNTDARVAGDHRSAVLQVIGIVPAGADLWPSSDGFYLQLSDSLNSTYVSLSHRDADAVLSNRPQLGHLVHVDRLLFDRPVPRAVGLRPVPSPRGPLPIAGRPEPLVARISPSADGFVIQPASPSDSIPIPAASRTVLAAKENNVPDAPPSAAPKRRFSSPAAAKLSSRKSTGAGGTTDHRGSGSSPVAAAPNKAKSRQASPAATRAASRSSSPVPSKCTVPSLTAAKEENRRASREPAIVVPSRYRQPSPVAARRGAASPVSRRSSGSPGRRLSGGLKVSPALLTSVRSVRKSWEDPSAGSPGASVESKEKGSSRSKVDQQAILRTQVAISQRLSDVGRDQSNVDKQNTGDKIETFAVSENLRHAMPKIIVHDWKWTDGSIPFDSISKNIAKLGKEALQRRNIASVAATEALEEALATESAIRSLSMFSDLCTSSRHGNPLPIIDRFLSIYDDVTKCNAIAESTERSKSASLWVDAALATDLQVLSLLNGSAVCPSNQKTSEKPALFSLDLPRQSMSKRHQPNILRHGMGETVELTRALKCEMQTWFLKFVDETLDIGFRLFGECSDGGSSRDNSKIAAVLSHLKRVNEWLDDVGRKPEDSSVKEKIERLKSEVSGSENEFHRESLVVTNNCCGDDCSHDSNNRVHNSFGQKDSSSGCTVETLEW